MVFFRKLYLIPWIVFIGYFSWQQCFATASEWNRWQRRRDRLTKLQQRITFPQLKSITVEGVTYTLPLKAVGPPDQEPTQEELEYLVGFFDGDGCVSMRSRTGEISLQITQNIDSAQILLLFRDKLGGGVSRHKNGTGLHKACLIWQVYGSTMHRAALLLGRIPLTMTWPRFAGFFDAEGSVSVRAHSVMLQLTIMQANPFILKHILAFLQNHGLQKWALYEHKSISQLSCSDLPTAKRTLELLLSSGLLVKKMQAKLALSMDRNNHQQVRKEVMKLNGWQNRCTRLDEEGSLLAKRIKALQDKTRTNSSKKEREKAGNQIQELKEELAFHKLVSRCRYVRAHIRQSLSDGALILPT